MTRIYLCGKLAGVLCLTIFLASTADAQRGSAAGGGRISPEGAKAEPTPDLGPTVLAEKEDECESIVGTCPGTYSFNYGFSANAAPRHGGPQAQKAGFAFAVYVTPRVFLEVDNDNVVSIKDASTPRVTGLGDTSFYIGADILMEGKGHPAVTLLYGIKAPTASSSKGIGSGKVDHTLLAAIGKSIGRTYFEVDLGDYIAGQANDSVDHFPFAAAFLKRKLDAKNRFILHTEVGGEFATKESNATMYNLNYLETRLSKKDSKHYIGLRTGARFGLTPNVSRAGFFLGLKFAGNLRNLF